MNRSLVYLMTFFILSSNWSNRSIAQAVSSNLKVVTTTWNVTEPMIAVNPTDQDNFIAVYSNWHNALDRYSASSRTTDGGVTWSDAEVPFRMYYDQADPCVAFDASGIAYFSYLDVNLPSNKIALVVAKSSNKGTSWTDTNIVVHEASPGVTVGSVPDKPWITTDLTSGPFRNTIYVVWTSINTLGSGNETYTIYLSYKRIGDRYFSSPIQVSATSLK